MKTTDKNLIEEYCKIKYGNKIVNSFDRTFKDEVKFIDNWYNNLPIELKKDITIILPDETYQERWKHKFIIHIINGVDIIDIREMKLNSIL